MTGKNLKFAPQELFEKILEFAVVPTFDLVVEFGGGVVLTKRKIPPYNGKWALPGLRIMKPENIDDTISRIAVQELGLSVDSKNRVFLGQFVGFFKTEHGRQDISTGYSVKAIPKQQLKINSRHFSSARIIKSENEIPPSTGAMYKFYLKKYFSTR